MRGTLTALIAACGLIAAAGAAKATPLAIGNLPVPDRAGIVEVAGGCGPGWHPVRYVNRWGHWRVRCVPNRRW